MNTLDIIFIAIIGLLAVRGVFRGFVEEIMSMASLILGVLAAVFLYHPVGKLIGSYLPNSVFPDVIGFLVVFLVTYLLVKILEKIFQDIMENVNLEGLDRALGFLLGIVEGLLVVCFILIVMTLLQSMMDKSLDIRGLLSHSVFAKILMPLIGVPDISKLGINLPKLPNIPAGTKP